jgi:hypothetical protein
VTYAICSTGAASSVALIVDVGYRHVHASATIHPMKLAESVGSALRKILAGPGSTWTTMARPKPVVLLTPDASENAVLHQDDLIALMTSYINLTPVQWNARLWGLKVAPPETLTVGERAIVAKPLDANKLRQELALQEKAKAFLKYVDDCKVLRISEFVGLDKLHAIRVDPDGRRYSVPFLPATCGLMLERSFILLGATGLGKTALARSMCRLFCKAMGTPYFVESNTVDSLRAVSGSGFFREHIPVLLDEWKPAGEKYSGKDGIDLLKCLYTVCDAKAVAARYSDIHFQDNQPKIQSCNCLSLDGWLECLGDASEADKDAVLRRVLFVEVTEPIVPAALRKEFLGKRREGCFGGMSVAAVAEGCDPANLSTEAGLGYTLMNNVNGVWKVAPTSGVESLLCSAASSCGR